MTGGLRRFSRHPNYFGNFMMMWSFYFMAIQTETGPYTVFGPIIITYFLFRISGVSLLESSSLKKKKGFEAYQKNTPAFFPKVSL